MNDTCICDNVPTVWRLTGVTRTLRLRIFNPDGTPLDLTGRTVAVTIARDNSEFSYAPGFVIEGDDGNVVKFEWPADKQGAGDYTINVTTTDGSGNVDRVNWHGPTGIRLVDFSFMVRGEDALGVTSEANIGLDGTFTMNGTGMSAYDEWLAEGHTGTPEEFIAWLRQPATDAASAAEAQMGQIQERADADHTRAGNDHTTAGQDHTRAGNDHTTAASDHGTAADDHTLAVSDHGTAADDHTTAGNDHTRAQADHGIAADDHATAGTDHTKAQSDHSTASADHTKAAQDSEQAASDHTRAGGDHDTAVADHAQAEADHTRAEADHTTAAADHTTAASDHTQATADHAVMAGYDTRLGNVEDEVTQLGQEVMLKKNKTTASGSQSVSGSGNIVTVPVDAGVGDIITVSLSGLGTIFSKWRLFNNDTGDTIDANITSETYIFTAETSISKLRLNIASTAYIASGTAAYSVVKAGWEDTILALKSNVETLQADDVLLQAAKEQILNSRFVGTGNVFAAAKIYGLVPNRKYRVILKSQTWDLSGVTIDATQLVFQIGNNVNDVAEGLVRVYLGDIPESYYDITVPATSDYIYVGGRAAVGSIVYFNVYDITDVDAISTKIDGNPKTLNCNYATTAGTVDNTAIEINIPHNGYYKIRYEGSSYPTVASAVFISKTSGSVTLTQTLQESVEKVVQLTTDDGKVKLNASAANTSTGTAILYIEEVTDGGLMANVDSLENMWNDEYTVELSFKALTTKLIEGFNIPAGKRFTLMIDSDFNYGRLDIYRGNTASSATRLLRSAVSGRYYTLVSDTAITSFTLELRTSTYFGKLRFSVNTDGTIKDAVKINNEITAESYLAKKMLEEYHLFDYTSESLNTLSYDTSSVAAVISRNYTFRNELVFEISTTADTLGYFRLLYNSAVNMVGVGFIELPVYIADPTTVTALYLRTNIAGIGAQSFNYRGTLKKGWNMLRFDMAQLNRSNYSNWSTLTQIFLYVQTSADATIYVTFPSIIKPPKALIIFVDDHGYHDFMTTAYPDLKALGVPCTWACQPGRLGAAVTGAGTLLTQADVEALSQDSYSEFSWHTYNSSQEQQMSVANLRAEFQKAITALRQLFVLPQYFWRAAWKQNDAANAMGCSNMAEAFATWNGNYGCESVPFNNRYNIARQEIHGKTETVIANMFQQLKCTHGLYVFYTHSIIAEKEEGLESHITQAEWNTFISYLATAINEGWLEGTTFNALRLKYGTDIYNK